MPAPGYGGARLSPSDGTIGPLVKCCVRGRIGNLAIGYFRSHRVLEAGLQVLRLSFSFEIPPNDSEPKMFRFAASLADCGIEPLDARESDCCECAADCILRFETGTTNGCKLLIIHDSQTLVVLEGQVQ